MPNQSQILRQRKIPLAGCVLLLCFLGLSSLSCKKELKLLMQAPQASDFVWDESVTKSVSKLQKAGWSLKLQNKTEVVLEVPFELSNKKAPPILKELTQEEAPSLAEITLYPEKGKLILARLTRLDTKKNIDQYEKSLLKNYGFKKALWSAKGKSSKDEIGNVHESQIALYEQKEVFVLVRRFFWKAIEKRLQKGRNHTLEVLFYSKKNPELNSQKLMQGLQAEAKLGAHKSPPKKFSPK